MLGTSKYLEQEEKAFDIDMRGKNLGEKRGKHKTNVTSLSVVIVGIIL